MPKFHLPTLDHKIEDIYRFYTDRQFMLTRVPKMPTLTENVKYEAQVTVISGDFRLVNVYLV